MSKDGDGKMVSKRKDKFNTIPTLLVSGIILVALIPIASEFFDIPSLVFGAPPTPVNWSVVIIGMALVLSIGFPVSFYLLRLHSRRKQAEEALRESEEKYRQVVNSAGEAIVVIQDGLAKFVNPRAVELFGYLSDGLVTTGIMELVHPDDREVAKKRYLATLKGGGLSPVYHTYRITGKGGDIKWMEIFARKITWEGNLRYWLSWPMLQSGSKQRRP